MRNVILISCVIFCFACHSKERSEKPGKTAEPVSSEKNVKAIFPLPVGHVNDFENILSTSEEQELQDTIEAFKSRSGNEIAIVTLDSIGSYTDFATYVTDLANTWGVGDSTRNTGLLIALSKNLRTVRIASGTGTARRLSDRFCSKVIESYMLPEFKTSNYYTGLRLGLNALIQEWEKPTD